jgi:cytochrome c peroxidase
MYADLDLLMTVGLAIVLFATSALVLLVRRDLAPTGGPASAVLDGGGRWFLGAALGIGVIAFAIKLAIILTLVSFPDQTIAPLIPDRSQAPPEEAAVAEEAAEMPPGYAWKALPDAPPDPDDNPTTPAKVALGERLFHDTALSADRTVSCASCHDVLGRAGTDGRATAVGITGIAGKRNAPTVWNAAYQARLFWDGRAGSLEEQAAGPPLNPDEMGMPSPAAIEERIAAEPTYRVAFAQAFGDEAPVTMKRITQAIAAFERTLVTPDAPYDRFVKGEAGALTPAQKRGMWLFQSVGCVTCHAGANFSGASLVGPRNPYMVLFASRSAVARPYRLTEDKGKAAAIAKDGIWRIPSLRNVAVTGPYFHNGAVADLAEAVRIMATSQLGATLSNDPRLRHVPAWSAERSTFDAGDRLVLNDGDVDDIVAFLKALTSDRLAARVALR